MSGTFSFRPADPVSTQNVSEVTLPESVWRLLESEATKAGLTLGQAFAQMAADRLLNGAAAVLPESAKRTRKLHAKG